jgi:hypothetical protein
MAETVGRGEAVDPAGAGGARRWGTDVAAAGPVGQRRVTLRSPF